MLNNKRANQFSLATKTIYNLVKASVVFFSFGVRHPAFWVNITSSICSLMALILLSLKSLNENENIQILTQTLSFSVIIMEFVSNKLYKRLNLYSFFYFNIKNLVF